MLIVAFSIGVEFHFQSLKNAVPPVRGTCTWSNIGTEPAATCASFNHNKRGCKGAGAGANACTWTAQGFLEQQDGRAWNPVGDGTEEEGVHLEIADIIYSFSSGKLTLIIIE